MPFADEPSEVTILDYQPQWPDDFDRLARQLQQALGRAAVAIDHIGSTSVPGLAAKDCIDIQVRVAQLDEPSLVQPLARIGYRCRPEPWNRVELSAGVTCRKLVFKKRLADSVPSLSDYGQIKAPATEVLMRAAERWAADTGWSPCWGTNVPVA